MSLLVSKAQQDGCPKVWVSGLLEWEAGPDGRYFLTTWAMGTSALAIKHDKPSKTEGYLPFQMFRKGLLISKHPFAEWGNVWNLCQWEMIGMLSVKYGNSVLSSVMAMVNKSDIGQ